MRSSNATVIFVSAKISFQRANSRLVVRMRLLRVFSKA